MAWVSLGSLYILRMTVPIWLVLHEDMLSTASSGLFVWMSIAAQCDANSLGL